MLSVDVLIVLIIYFFLDYKNTHNFNYMGNSLAVF